ncbi:MAG TPA: tetratricopeptide repeat protein, partial [Rhizomicrobium sp.]|nr:tetratricopeptide repeat protein [Rhizomicrobium sp.]
MEVLDLKAMAEQAVAFHQRGELGQAEALYLRILEVEPLLYGPRYYLGLLKLQQGLPQEACDCLGDAVRISPDQLPAWMNYGMALQAAGRAEEALAAFDRALAMQP